MKISDEDFKELRNLEEKLWKADTRFNKAWMDKIRSPNFFEIGRLGQTYTREVTIACKSKAYSNHYKSTFVRLQSKINCQKCCFGYLY